MRLLGTKRPFQSISYVRDGVVRAKGENMEWLYDLWNGCFLYARRGTGNLSSRQKRLANKGVPNRSRRYACLGRWGLVVVFITGCKATDFGSFESAIKIPDAETPSGILVYVHSGEPKFDIETLENWWIDVQQCLQMTAPPPVIRYANDTREVCSSATGAAGNMCNNGDGLGWFIAINSSWAHVAHETKHEMIHYIRQLNGYSDHANHDFENDAFWQCRFN